MVKSRQVTGFTIAAKGAPFENTSKSELIERVF
jgi:hypothetical protein